MVYTRRDVWMLNGDWPDELLWYAKAIRSMQGRAFTDPTSWLFLAAMHGLDVGLWTQFGYLPSTFAKPTALQTNCYIAKCQHQTWYFLPWHRGYLAAFEAIVRAAVVAGGGPSDWALPYWNYNNPHQLRANELPVAFSSPTMPDGSANPLNVLRRYGNGPLPITLDAHRIRPDALGDSAFAGDPSSIPPGFGGPPSAFHHGDEADNLAFGALESEPHNNVHVDVGGSAPGLDPNNPVNWGLMTNPDTAALDPIFWLHHANIDRMWEIWLQTTGHTNPTDVAWLKGPAATPFAMPTPSGGDFQFSAAQMLNTQAPNLSYVYDDLSTPVAPTSAASRLALLGVPAQAARQLASHNVTIGSPMSSEIMGSNDAPVSVAIGGSRTTVRLDRKSVNTLANSLLSFQTTGSPREPDRVYLRLENVRTKSDAAVVSVYIGLAPGKVPTPNSKAFVGSISTFGVTKASQRRGTRPGNGASQVFDITPVVDALHLNHTLGDLDHLDVSFVPERGLAEGGVSVGKVTVYRYSR